MRYHPGPDNAMRIGAVSKQAKRKPLMVLIIPLEVELCIHNIVIVDLCNYIY